MLSNTKSTGTRSKPKLTTKTSKSTKATRSTGANAAEAKHKTTKRTKATYHKEIADEHKDLGEQKGHEEHKDRRSEKAAEAEHKDLKCKMLPKLSTKTSNSKCCRS
eukprot:2370506-Amphidinium_carterae.1